MVKSQHKVFHKEHKTGEEKKYQRHITKLEKEIDELKAKIRVYEREFTEIKFIKERKNTNVEKIIQEKGTKTENTRNPDKWRCHECDQGILRLIVIQRPDKKVYFRKCSHCDNRTQMKDYHEGVKE
jgi:hypothetical protein